MANSKSPDKLIVIAASAGGVNALIELTARLPGNLSAPVIIVQHLRASERETRLHQVLGRKCILPISLAEDGMEIAPGRIYLARPGYHLELEGEVLRLNDDPPVVYVKPAANVLFCSTETSDRKIIAVVLTGSGRDGTTGCKAIKARGGIVIAQDEASSFNFRMPGSAIAADCVDHVLPLEEISAKLVTLVEATP